MPILVGNGTLALFAHHLCACLVQVALAHRLDAVAAFLCVCLQDRFSSRYKGVLKGRPAASGAAAKPAA